MLKVYWLFKTRFVFHPYQFHISFIIGPLIVLSQTPRSQIPSQFSLRLPFRRKSTRILNGASRSFRHIGRSRHSKSFISHVARRLPTEIVFRIVSYLAPDFCGIDQRFDFRLDPDYASRISYNSSPICQLLDDQQPTTIKIRHGIVRGTSKGAEITCSLGRPSIRS
ncbi:hypothetical protein BT63DRAFT_460675 [Microthyrium microscopicum]|uniref:Uncharacterized protein n=1 Tax=Microthyrium microscopicum TaxID=703497 RepID=A0A6A6U0C1_9PEZI|nr:hypothetical protein BT63DRAFT_460675 [Microthyrium microscopicum]